MERVSGTDTELYARLVMVTEWERYTELAVCSTCDGECERYTELAVCPTCDGD